MTDRLIPYRSYKHPGVDWLGSIPKHWEVGRAEHRLEYTKKLVPAHELNGRNILHYSIPNVQQFGTGAIESGTSVDADKLLVDRTLLLVSKLNPRKGTVTLAEPSPELTTLASTEFIAMEPKGCLAEFAMFLFTSEFVRRELSSRVDSATNSHQRCSPTDITKLRIPWPPLTEQTNIVRFLDHIGRRIYRYILAKQKLLSHLDEQKHAAIYQAISGKVDVRTGNPFPAYKPSGVEWVGEVPEHWEVRRLRNVTDMRVSNVDKHVKDGENRIRLCNYVDVYNNDYINKRMDFMHATATNEEIERFRLEKDDVLITKDSETWDDIGVPALVTEPACDLISGYHLALLRPRPDKLVGAYLLRALQSKLLAHQFHVEAKGVTRYGLSHAGIKSVWIPLPPLAEQTAIVHYLNEISANTQTAITRMRRQIELFQEYRTRLIADVVTGKLDVSEAYVNLSNDTESMDDPSETGTINDAVSQVAG